MKYHFFALFAGILFGLGLAVSGMTDPSKVQSFLDIAGEWNITLAFVMIGALLVTTITFPLILKRPAPIAHTRFELPSKISLEPKLIWGSILFGAGWALVGLCPGPALASLFYGYWQTIVFVVAMLVGSRIGKYWDVIVNKVS